MNRGSAAGDNLGRSELLEAMQACRILVSHNDASEPD